MSLTVGIGFNDGEDAYTVGANACQDAFDRLKDSHADLVIVFSSVLYDQEKMLEGVRSVSKDTLLVGASTSGEITAAGPLIRHSVVVMLIKSDTVRFFVGVGEGIEKDPHVAGKSAADAVRIQTSEEFSMFMMFPDVLAGNGAATVRGVQDSLGPNIPIVGGAAGDDFRFEKTYQYLNEKVYSGAVVGVGFVGNCTWGIGVKHGWIPVGIPKKVTRSEGSILHELDGKPAISIYDEYFGEEEAKQLRAEKLAKLAITYPLGMRIEGSDEMLIRDPLTVDENGAMTCTAEIPVGTEVNLMVGSREEAEQVSRIAAKSAIDQLHGADPKVAFIFNCIARSKLFGERAGEEISMIQECVGSRIPLIGFYTYGEIAPLKGDTRRETCNSIFHNETVVICLLAG